MARNSDIRLRRSATAGAVPTTAALNLGELAINTYDGKIYLKKDVSGTESIVEIGASTDSQEAVWKEYVYTATSNQTSFSGSDDNSNTLSYTPLFLQVFLNGVLLDNGTDYTATSGSSVVLVNGASASDLLQIASFVKVIGNGDIVVNSFTGDGSTAAYTLTANPDTEDNTTVFVDGVYQEKDTYAVSGTTLTFDANVPNSASIEVLIGSKNVTLSDIADLDISGNLSLVDNKKLLIGTGNDLEIYHDGSNSIIEDAGTGHVQVRSGTFTVANAAMSKVSAVFNSGTSQDFYYDNAKKLETTATGIDVTGTATMDGLDSSGTAFIRGASAGRINLDDSGVADGSQPFKFLSSDGGSLIFGTANRSGTSTTSSTEIARFDGSGNFGIGTDSPASTLDIKGDGAEIYLRSADYNVARIIPRGTGANLDKGLLSLFDTGVENVRIDTEGNSWFNGGNVGIGTNSPTDKLNISSGTNQIGLDTGNQATYGTLDIGHFTNGAFIGTQAGSNAVSNVLRLGTSGSERMRINSSGNVGIGTTSPNYELTVGGSDAINSIQLLSSTTGTGANNGLRFWNTGSSVAMWNYDNTPTLFGTNNTERLRIDSSGNVGIGTTAPAAKLQVEEYGIDTTETSTTATTQVAIHTMAAATFRSARFTVQVTNSTDSTYHLTEILMIHDGTTPSITEYGTIFTGSAEATFDADISSGNIRLLATPASTDSMEFKVICHSITV